MPVVLALLLMVAAAALGYAVVINAAHNAIARGASPETTALRLLPPPVRRHAWERLLPGWEWPEAEVEVEEEVDPEVFAEPELEPHAPPTAPFEPEFRGKPERTRRRRLPRRRRPVRLPARSRAEMRAGRRALRKAAREDAPLPLQVFSAVRLAILVALISIGITASVWLATVYVVSLFNRAIRG